MQLIGWVPQMDNYGFKNKISWYKITKFSKILLWKIFWIFLQFLMKNIGQNWITKV